LRGQFDSLDHGFSVSTRIAVLELGVGAQTVVPLSESGESGLLIMLQAGYTAQLLHGDWSPEGSEAGYEGPRANVGGAFARLALGWGIDGVTRKSSREQVADCAGDGCELRCTGPFASCDGDPRNGCETELGTDANCSACEDRCSAEHGQAICERGACRVQGCQPNFADCNALAVDGCEIDLRVEPRHCGECGRACPEGVSCIAGECGNPEPAVP